jgi:hypothetical protein
MQRVVPYRYLDPKHLSKQKSIFDLYAAKLLEGNTLDPLKRSGYCNELGRSQPPAE